MARVEKTVFISYRRANVPWALAIFQDLTHHGFDVFFDYDGIASGSFAEVILENIRARAHFVVLLTPSALDRVEQTGDWFRREIETAIQSRRNILPLMLEGFNFGSEQIAKHLTGTLAPLKEYNGLEVPPAYFAEAMQRLRERYLNVALEAVLKPAASAALQFAASQEASASQAAPVSSNELKAQQLYERAHNAADAVEKMTLLNEALDLHPSFAAGWAERAWVKQEQGNFDGSLADYNTALSFDPYNVIALNGRGWLHYRMKNWNPAEVDLNRAIALHPERWEPHHNRALLYWAGLDDLPRALPDFAEAIRLNPKSTETYYNRAAALMKQDPAAAIADFETYLRLGGKSQQEVRNVIRILTDRSAPKVAEARTD